MGEVIAGILILAFIAILLIMNWQRSQSTANTWEDFAAEHDLQFEGSILRIRSFDQSPFWIVQGVYRGRAIKLEAFSKYATAGSILSALTGGAPGEPFTRITREVKTVKPRSFSLELRRRDASTALSSIKTGDEHFDRLFTIKSSPPDLAISIFGSHTIRESSQGLKGELTLDTQGLHYEEAGLVRDAERLRHLNDLLADLSSAIESVDRRYSASEV